MKKSPYQKVINLLQDHNIDFKEYRHEEVKTSEEAQAVRPEYTLSQGAKAIIIKAKKRKGEYEYSLFILPADLRINSSKIRKILKAKSVSFASQDEVKDVTDGIITGGVHPFGNLFDMKTYVDPRIKENEEIIFNAGDRGISIALKTKDYLLAVNPYIIDFTRS
jgi:Cys-tRNA(Pro) deacylase